MIVIPSHPKVTKVIEHTHSKLQDSNEWPQAMIRLIAEDAAPTVQKSRFEPQVVSYELRMWLNQTYIEYSKSFFL